MEAIAIVGMACRYPDADTPTELWENVLAQRRAFRRIPPQRLRFEDYFSSDRNAPDRTYTLRAAVLEGYEFDRVRFRISGSAFRSVDMAHWLALDVAADALEDAGFAAGVGLPRDTTGVLLGNTLTGEISRANQLRLRWPYVSRVLHNALREVGWDREQTQSFLRTFEAQYKAPFPPITEESLAGGLSNTIAGRICNYFDLKGAGYTIDGACASSLLAVANACSALACGDVDVALAGGVDLSLDPFELVGFAKLGALAAGEMRVFDAHSAGFLPGEGCGFVVLMRHSDAIAQERPIYALISGWGVSSDGNGGITRPEVAGQLMALQRAYQRAKWGIETVEYFEAHGTGTSVGDATELQTLSRARREAKASDPAAIGSIKANVGHTKAAAGVAGLIKATLAVKKQVLPPTTGCEHLHPELAGEAPSLRILRSAEPWPAKGKLRAGVSAMGFGGINAHVAIEGVAAERIPHLQAHERDIAGSAQDCELFLFGADDWNDLRAKVEPVAAIASQLSLAELTDLSVSLARMAPSGEVRASVVAATPEELAGSVEKLLELCARAPESPEMIPGITAGRHSGPPTIGFAFPGQGTPFNIDGGIFRRRFIQAQELYDQGLLPTSGDPRSTEVAQPCIVGLSIAALRLLRALGVEADVAVGHSLGELTALHWSGAMDEATLLRIAGTRGMLMATLARPGGAMASLAASQEEVAELLRGSSAVIAGVNGPRQTVISGDQAAVAAVAESARVLGIHSVALPVSCAFHSPLMEPVIPALRVYLCREQLGRVQGSLVSTVTSSLLSPDTQIEDILCEQVTAPVMFMDAVRAANRKGVTLWVEVGPGQVLSRMLTDLGKIPAVSMGAGGPSLLPALESIGTLFVFGAPLNLRPLVERRYARAFELDRRPKFISNPCEQAPIPEQIDEIGGAAVAEERSVAKEAVSQTRRDPLEVVKALVAQRAELPEDAVRDQNRLLSDLHLNSITVGQIVVQAAKALGLAAPNDVTNYADASVLEIAEALKQWRQAGKAVETGAPAGLDAWIRAYSVKLVERARPPLPVAQAGGAWTVVAPAQHPLANPLKAKLEQQPGGGGVLVCLPEELDDSVPRLLLQARDVVLRDQPISRMVLVQARTVGGAFLRSLHVEDPRVIGSVVRVPFHHPQACEWVLQEAFARDGYSEAWYDENGTRHEPVLSPQPLRFRQSCELTQEDVLLISGGGKGIAAECALALARDTGVRLLLIGRSNSERDPVLRMNLKRFEAAGMDFHYVAADVSKLDSARRAFEEGEAQLGQVTAILHAAGNNLPQSIRALDLDAFQRTLAPKIDGLRNLLSLVHPERLRLLITFGSLIARTGFPGEADYALANEWMTYLTEDWQNRHPQCRCLAVEWSAWSGVGMGAQVANIAALENRGISLIPPGAGCNFLIQLLHSELPDTSVVATSRFGEPDTVQVDRPPLPSLRFLEKPRVFYPGVELITDVPITPETDLYLQDHELHGERVLPAVMGLEQMAQTAMALVGSRTVPVLEEVEFFRPIVIGDGSVVRAVALARESSRVDVALRSDATGFAVDHFRARCSFQSIAEPAFLTLDHDQTPLPLDPARDLYGVLMFQGPRFQCVRHYTHLSAGACVAELAPKQAEAWFARYLPSELVLGHPGIRDAAIHALQACIPHQRVLPVAVSRIVIRQTTVPGPMALSAIERHRDRSNFVYDLELKAADGAICESWQGLRLRSLESLSLPSEWPYPLLAPYLERRLHELAPECDVKVALARCDTADSRGERMMLQLLPPEVSILRREDGKPEIPGAGVLSAAHSAGFAMAIGSPFVVGCDLEFVEGKPESLWKGLLGPASFSVAIRIAHEAGEDIDAAATRLWAALESLKKAGASRDVPLTLIEVEKDGWIRLAAGPWKVESLVIRVRDCAPRLAIATCISLSAARSAGHNQTVGVWDKGN